MNLGEVEQERAQRAIDCIDSEPCGAWVWGKMIERWEACGAWGVWSADRGSRGVELKLQPPRKVLI